MTYQLQFLFVATKPRVNLADPARLTWKMAVQSINQSINALIVLQLTCWIGYSKHYLHHINNIHKSECQIVKGKKAE